MGTDKEYFALVPEENNYCPNDEQIIWIIQKLRQYNIIRYDSKEDDSRNLNKIITDSSQVDFLVERLVNHYLLHGKLNDGLVKQISSQFPALQERILKHFCDGTLYEEVFLEKGIYEVLKIPFDPTKGFKNVLKKSKTCMEERDYWLVMKIYNKESKDIFDKLNKCYHILDVGIYSVGLISEKDLKRYEKIFRDKYKKFIKDIETFLGIKCKFATYTILRNSGAI